MLFSIGDTTVMFIVIPACSVFDSNECVSGGIVNVFQYSIEFQGRNIFVNNIGPVLQVCMCGHYVRMCFCGCACYIKSPSILNFLGLQGNRRYFW